MPLNTVYIYFFLLNLFIFIFYKKISRFINIYDTPDGKRKIHKGHIPLIGGTIIFINILFVLFFMYFESTKFFFGDYLNTRNSFGAFYFGCTSLYLLGLYDDKHVISAGVKLSLMTFISLIVVLMDEQLIISHLYISFYNTGFDLDNFSILFSVICFLLFLNAFNMFDGINLQSISYTLIIFIIFFNNNVATNFSVIIIFSVLFISILNYKNKVFLGDSGTYLISFIISFLFIKASGENIFYADEIFLIMLIPGLELLRLSISRLLKRKHPFSPDRNHIHHIIHDRLGYTLSLLIIFSLILVPIIINEYSNNIYSIIFGFLSYSFLILFLKIKFPLA